jgi:transposase
MGRPTKMNDGLKSAIKLIREKGMGIKQIAIECDVGVGTVYSVIEKSN